MSNSIGLHVAGSGNIGDLLGVAERLARRGTPIPVVLIVSDPGLCTRFDAVSHQTDKYYRWVGSDHDPSPFANDPATWPTGRQWFDRMWTRHSQATGADYHILKNECSFGGNTQDERYSRAVNDFELAAMTRANELGVHITIGDFMPGVPEQRHMDLLRPALAFAEQHGHVLNYHAYTNNQSDTTFTNGAEWFALRWVKWVADYPRLKVVLGESGHFNSPRFRGRADMLAMMSELDGLLLPLRQAGRDVRACMWTLRGQDDPQWAVDDITAELPAYEVFMATDTAPAILITSPVDPSRQDILVNGWIDATGYAKRYRIGQPNEAYHTGLDLNKNTPLFDADAHSAVYACADGTVTAAGKYDGWGNVIVINHAGVKFYARYAHVEKMLVNVGQVVKRGDQIASVGNADGLYPYHLHYDISATEALKNNPADWPKLDLPRLQANYVDPSLVHHNQGLPVTEPPAATFTVYTTDKLNVRSQPNTTSTVLTVLDKGAGVVVSAYNELWHKRTAGGYISKAYCTVLVPPPETGVLTVWTTANLNVRALPNTTSVVLEVIPVGTQIRVTNAVANWSKLVDKAGYVSNLYYTATKPPVVVTWSPPITPLQRGLHASAGGWSPTTAQLDLVRANGVKFVLIPCYELQPQAIAQFRSAGVEQFMFRACVHNPLADSFVQHFVEITLPILQAYSANLPNAGRDMMIVIGNEPNLNAEGWGVHWRNGTEFAAWWLTVATEFRKALPMCRLGFPAMSPGGNIPNVRTDEQTFVREAAAAIKVADFSTVHYYWQREDGSDIAPPVALWRSQFGAKAVICTEGGPSNDCTVTDAAVKRAYDVFGAAGVPIAQWLLDAAGGNWHNAAWSEHNINIGG